MFCTFGQFWLIPSKTPPPPQSQLTNESNYLTTVLSNQSTKITVLSRDLSSCLEGFYRNGEKNFLIAELMLVSYDIVITAPEYEEASFSFHCSLAS